jgi:hypothetical protein
MRSVVSWTSSRKPLASSTEHDEQRFKERSGKFVKHKPVEKPSG